MRQQLVAVNFMEIITYLLENSVDLLGGIHASLNSLLHIVFNVVFNIRHFSVHR